MLQKGMIGIRRSPEQIRVRAEFGDLFRTHKFQQSPNVLLKWMMNRGTPMT